MVILQLQHLQAAHHSRVMHDLPQIMQVRQKEFSFLNHWSSLTGTVNHSSYSLGEKMASVSIPGFTSGNIILKNILISEHPSTRAASSNSLGKAAK